MDNHSDDVVRIQFSKNREVLIDAQDSDLLSIKWYLRGKPGYFYAYSIAKGKRFPMHRYILERKLNRPVRDDYDCDHINGNTLDNRRSNLREVTRSQNLHNLKSRSNNTSGFIGVHYHKSANKWVAETKVDGKSVYLGLHDTPEKAHAAYLEFKRKHGLLPPESGG